MSAGDLPQRTQLLVFDPQRHLRVGDLEVGHQRVQRAGVLEQPGGGADPPLQGVERDLDQGQQLDHLRAAGRDDGLRDPAGDGRQHLEGVHHAAVVHVREADELCVGVGDVDAQEDQAGQAGPAGAADDVDEPDLVETAGHHVQEERGLSRRDREHRHAHQLAGPDLDQRDLREHPLEELLVGHA